MGRGFDFRDRSAHAGWSSQSTEPEVVAEKALKGHKTQESNGPVGRELLRAKARGNARSVA
jgi:hypothetical protein